MVKGRKLTKKQLKEPDEFITLTERAVLFIETHLKKVIAAGIIIAVIVLGFILLQMSERKKEAEADQKLALAMEAYQKVNSPYREGSPSDYKNSLKNFEEITRQYSGTSGGTLSLLYQGNIHLKLGEFDEAIKAFQTFLDKAGKEKLYRVFGLEGLGYASEGKKDYAKAIDAYQQIIAMGETFQSGDAYLALGRCYEKSGKNKEALDNYNAYLKTAKKSGITNEVLRKVSLLEK